MLATVLKVYNDLWDIRDRRLDGYFLADSLTVNIALVCLYVFLVKVVGPWHMKNRDPYNPKLLMQAYNLFQVVFCSYFVIEGGRKAWFNHYSWGKSGKNRRSSFMLSFTYRLLHPHKKIAHRMEPLK